MLYILGGAPRSGKTLLSRRAVEEKKIPYIPLDGLVTALAYGAPQVGISFDMHLVERAIAMWPITKELLGCLMREERDFLVEGDSILPSHVVELSTENKNIKTCFLGYPTMNRDEKLALIREHHQGELDWTKEISDEDLSKMVEEMVSFSGYLVEESAKYDIAFFDVSKSFDVARVQAFSYLFGE